MNGKIHSEGGIDLGDMALAVITVAWAVFLIWMLA
jgi:hypothetical protein